MLSLVELVKKQVEEEGGKPSNEFKDIEHLTIPVDEEVNVQTFEKLWNNITNLSSKLHTSLQNNLSPDHSPAVRYGIKRDFFKQITRTTSRTHDAQSWKELRFKFKSRSKQLDLSSVQIDESMLFQWFNADEGIVKECSDASLLKKLKKLKVNHALVGNRDVMKTANICSDDIHGMLLLNRLSKTQMLLINPHDACSTEWSEFMKDTKSKVLLFSEKSAKSPQSTFSMTCFPLAAFAASFAITSCQQ